MTTTTTAALIGCPDDRGVANNGGRPGAAYGPAAFRRWLQKPKGRRPVQAHLADRGNVPPARRPVRHTHDRVARVVQSETTPQRSSLIVGGGHDYAYAQLKGVSHSLEAGERLGCINIDPHFDMRACQQPVLSGSPFYMALEEERLAGPDMVSFGIQQFANGPELWDYAEQQGVVIHTREQMRFSGMMDRFQQAVASLAQRCDAIALSLDLDALNLAYAPGVSAPNVEGFSPAEVLAMIETAAQHTAVRSLGIYELNPAYDQDGHTARFAATVAFTFLDHRFHAPDAQGEDSAGL